MSSAVTDTISLLWKAYTDFEQALNEHDWTACQLLLADADEVFTKLFQMPDGQLLSHFAELKRLKERHMQVLTAVTDIRNKLSNKLIQVRRGEKLQRHYHQSM